MSAYRRPLIVFVILAVLYFALSLIPNTAALTPLLPVDRVARQIPLPAKALPEVPFATASGWQILRVKGIAGGCAATMGYSNGSFLSIGFDLNGRPKNFFHLHNPRWDSLDDNSAVPLSLEFDDLEPIVETAVTMHVGKELVLVVLRYDDRLIASFRQSRIVTVKSAGRLLTRLDLAGAAAADTEIIRCQDAARAAGSAKTAEEE